MSKALHKQTSIPVATQSKEWVCSRSLSGIVGSNPPGAWIFCLLSVLCVGMQRSPLLAYHSHRGVLSSAVCMSVIAKPRKGTAWPGIRWKRHRKNKELYIFPHDSICDVKRDQSLNKLKSLKDETNVDLLWWGKESLTLNPICMHSMHCAGDSIPLTIYPASRYEGQA